MAIFVLSFHQTPDLPEVLVQGKERQYLSWFYKELAYNPEAITQEDIDEFISHYTVPRKEKRKPDLNTIGPFLLMQYKMKK